MTASIPFLSLSCVAIVLSPVLLTVNSDEKLRTRRQAPPESKPIQLPVESEVFSWTEMKVKSSAKYRGTLVFEENFNRLDVSVWKPEITMSGGGNGEFEYYLNNRSNSFVRNGVLYLKPTLTADTIGKENVQKAGYTMSLWGGSPASQCTGNAFYGCEKTNINGESIINPIQSAALRSVNSFSFQYGQVEVRAKLPKGDWIWPAIWMLPTHNQYGNWPCSGEIDIMESRGNPTNYSAGGFNQYGSTLHWGPFWPIDPYEYTHAVAKAPPGFDFTTDFHTYGLIWNETYIGTYVDHPGQPVLRYPIKESFWSKGKFSELEKKIDNPWEGQAVNAPFDQKFYFVLNVAVGGTGGYFPDSDGKPWTDGDPAAMRRFWESREKWLPSWRGDDVAMQIDSIKVWQMNPRGSSVSRCSPALSIFVIAAAFTFFLLEVVQL